MKKETLDEELYPNFENVMSSQKSKQETLEEAAHNYFLRGQLGFEKAADTERAFLRGGL